MHKIFQNIFGSNNNQNIYLPRPLDEMPLRRVVRKCIEENVQNSDFTGFVDNLARYMAEVDGPIIGLEEKLKNGGRPDLLDSALKLKESFYKNLTREQLAPSIQDAYVHILACIITIFEQKILPLIKGGKSPEVIDKAIYEEIINHIYTEISDIREFNHNMEDIRGMLYYLTGNCHIKWN